MKCTKWITENIWLVWIESLGLNGYCILDDHSHGMDRFLSSYPCLPYLSLFFLHRCTCGYGLSQVIDARWKNTTGKTQKKSTQHSNSCIHTQKPVFAPVPEQNNSKKAKNNSRTSHWNEWSAQWAQKLKLNELIAYGTHLQLQAPFFLG